MEENTEENLLEIAVVSRKFEKHLLVYLVDK